MALILVTGASTGLGLGAAMELAHDAHEVVVHARTPDRVPHDDARWAGSVVGDWRRSWMCRSGPLPAATRC